MSKGSRRSGRELALKIIYSFPDQGVVIEQILDDFWRNFRFQDDVLGEALDEHKGPVPPDVREFTEDLVRGVYQRRPQIDEIIQESSTNWSLERMSRVDRALLRLAAFELLARPETPSSVVINEAIEIGKRFGTRETPAFINGILDKISHQHRKPEP